MSNHSHYFQQFDLNQFKALCSQTTNPSDYPLATAIQQNAVVYDGETVLDTIKDPIKDSIPLRSEWNQALKSGPGIVVIKKAYPDLSVIDEQSSVLKQIISEEKQSNTAKGDHFGSNERIWNALQKACIKAPKNFIDYYSNPLLAIISLAWLGPGYQMTTQVNNVKKGSKAQIAHRDYHLGFQSLAVKEQFACHTQIMSQFLTLQGAIAHGDVPISSGPTMLLPFSQQYDPGYMAYERPEFIEFFNQNFVQIPLEKGDMLFFNPALFHGAGENQNEADRLVNLIQVSSPMGKTMETLDHPKMILATYPHLLDMYNQSQSTEDTQRIDNAIAAVADGYSFPTNLDLDSPIGGNAPKTQQQLVKEGLKNNWSVAQLDESLKTMANRRKSG